MRLTLFQKERCSGTSISNPTNSNRLPFSRLADAIDSHILKLVFMDFIFVQFVLTLPTLLMESSSETRCQVSITKFSLEHHYQRFQIFIKNHLRNLERTMRWRKTSGAERFQPICTKSKNKPVEIICSLRLYFRRRC